MPASKPREQSVPTTGAVWHDPAPLAEDVDLRAPPNEFEQATRGAAHPPVREAKDVKRAMSDGKSLLQRYVCHVCGVCVATSEGHQSDEAEVHVFSRLHQNIVAKQGSKTVFCPCCEQALGSRGNNNFLLRKGLVVMKQDRLEVLVFSLKEREITEVTPVLQEAFPHCNVTPRVLQKAELRGFELAATMPSPDLVVVVHRNEGRALLTDRNGFYHDVLGSAWQQTRGNVLVVLTRTELKGSATELFDGQLLKALSTQGDQPTIGAISACGRVLTWETQPSKQQLQQLQLLSEKAYFREPPETVRGIPVAWAKAPKPPAAAAWCTLL